jgi:hypothetical protein
MSEIQTDLVVSLNRESPTLARLPLGTWLANLITQYNALRADLTTIKTTNAYITTAAALAIKAAEGLLVKSTGAFAAVVAGNVITKAANTDMAALVGTLATAKSAAWAFEVDSSGTITTLTKTADVATPALAIAALAAVTANKVRIGYIVVTNTSGSNFVGGTTALDATGIAVTYVNTAALALTAEALDELT